MSETKHGKSWVLSIPRLTLAALEHSALEVAPNLLGCILVSCSATDGQITAGMITETEAYGGPNDEASHGYRGKTVRNSSFFLPRGHFYVYRSYGIHHCVNITTGDVLLKKHAEGVLIRALFPVEGIDTMRRRRGKDHTFPISKLTAGPGMVTQALCISIEHDGLPLKNATSLWITQPIRVFIKDAITITPRIGITKSQELNWRFRLQATSTN